MEKEKFQKMRNHGQDIKKFPETRWSDLAGCECIVIEKSCLFRSALEILNTKTRGSDQIDDKLRLCKHRYLIFMPLISFDALSQRAKFQLDASESRKLYKEFHCAQLLNLSSPMSRFSSIDGQHSALRDLERQRLEKLMGQLRREVGNCTSCTTSAHICTVNQFLYCSKFRYSNVKCIPPYVAFRTAICVTSTLLPRSGWCQF